MKALRNLIMALMMLCLTCATNASAQQLNRRSRNAAIPDMPVRELGFHLQGGISSLQYTAPFGSSSMNFGLGGGMSYTYFPKAQLGLTVGLEAMLFRGKIDLGSPPFTENLTSPDYVVSATNVTTGESVNNMPYHVENKIDLFAENQSALFLQLPLMLQTQMVVKPGVPHYLYGALGLKPAFAVSASYEQTIKGAATMHLDKDNFGLPLGDDFFGMGPFEFDKKDKLSLGFNLAATVELGLRWQLPDNMAIYTGLFCDYGFINVATGSGALVTYDQRRLYKEKPRTADDIASILATNLLERANTLAFGAKMRYAFAVGKIKKQGPTQKGERVDKYYKKRAYLRLIARDVYTDQPLDATLEVFDRQNNKFADSVMSTVGTSDYRIPIPAGVAYTATFSVKLPPGINVPAPAKTAPPKPDSKVVEGTSIIKVIVNDARSGNPLPFKITFIDNVSQKLIDSTNVNPGAGPYENFIPIDKTYRMLVAVSVPTSKRRTETAALALPFKQVKVGQKIALRNIVFPSGKSTISAESRPELEKIVSFLKDFSDVRLEISGHTDNVGAPEHNKRLSTARAKAIVDYLVSKGISRDRLRSLGYGATRPVTSNQTAKGRALNRRIELKIVK